MTRQPVMKSYYRPIFWRLGRKRKLGDRSSYAVACRHRHDSPSSAMRCGYWKCKSPEGFTSEPEVICFEPRLANSPRRLSIGEESQAKKVNSPRKWEVDEVRRLRRNKSPVGGRKAGRNWSGGSYRITLLG